MTAEQYIHHEEQLEAEKNKPCIHAWHIVLDVWPNQIQGGTPFLLEIRKIMCKKCSTVLSFSGIEPGAFPTKPGCGVDGIGATFPLVIGAQKFEVKTEVVQVALPPQDEFQTK